MLQQINLCIYNIYMDLVATTFIFNIICILFFAFIYSMLSPSNFMTLSENNKLTTIDYIFYSTTIQSGVGLPDITAVKPLSKILAIIQQLILMGSMLVILRYFISHK
jgi:hypothetical protein